MAESLLSQSVIDVCTSCSYPVNLLAPTAGHLVDLALCANCERRHYIMASASDTVSGELMHGKDALRGFSPARHLSVQREFSLEQMIGELASDVEEEGRRLHYRLLAALPLVVAPLDEEFRPINVASKAASIDISARGILFEVSCNQSASFWLVDFGPAGHVGAQAVMKVVRMEPMEDCWKVAGPLATRQDVTRFESKLLLPQRCK